MEDVASCTSVCLEPGERKEQLLKRSVSASVSVSFLRSSLWITALSMTTLNVISMFGYNYAWCSQSKPDKHFLTSYIFRFNSTQTMQIHGRGRKLLLLLQSCEICFSFILLDIKGHSVVILSLSTFLWKFVIHYVNSWIMTNNMVITQATHFADRMSKCPWVWNYKNSPSFFIDVWSTVQKSWATLEPSLCIAASKEPDRLVIVYQGVFSNCSPDFLKVFQSFAALHVICLFTEPLNTDLWIIQTQKGTKLKGRISVNVCIT